VTADESYIRESILDPGAKIVEGWQNIMPTFRGQTSEEEIFEIIAFIKSLTLHETPRRVDDYPPPLTTPAINAAPLPSDKTQTDEKAKTDKP